MNPQNTSRHGPVAPHQDFPLLPRSPPEMGNAPSSNGLARQNMPNGGRDHHRLSGEYRQNMPHGSKANPAEPHAGMRARGQYAGGGAFEGARSPPNAAKNTSHVPCKFFKLGQCQAGKACPFSHSTDASKFEQPCKYFSKGNCKFGQKCALLHILQDGRIVNRPNGGVSHLGLGNRVEPMAYHHQESALGNSLLAQEANGIGSRQPFGHQLAHLGEMDNSMPIPMHSQPYDIPQSKGRYGTPREEALPPMSPLAHLTIRDAPFPASFDTKSISRREPVSTSFPAKFDLDSSSPPSLPQAYPPPTDALRNLHDSAYGREGTNRFEDFGSSPSARSGEFMGQRVMHSQRVMRPTMMSSSMPVDLPNSELEDELLFGGEEDYVPEALSHLLNADERQRRSSSKIQDPMSIRESLLGNHTPNDTSIRAGSLSVGSPSRFSALFSKQKRDEEANGITSSSFGHVGSPLRNSSLHLGTSPGVRAVSRTASSDMGFQVSSPPRQSSTSVLSQQLQRTRLSRAESSESPSGRHPLMNRHTSNPRVVYDRAVSSSSVTTDRIDEEQPEFVFSLDEEEFNGQKSSPWNPTTRPTLGSIGDGRHSLGAQNGDDGKESGVIMPPRHKF